MTYSLSHPPTRTASYALDLHVFKKKAEAATLLNACLGYSFPQDLKKTSMQHIGRKDF